jgi:hypothetical protein
MSTVIKSFSQFVNENVNNQRVFEAEEKVSEKDIKSGIFSLVAYPTTKEKYSKLLSTMTGKDIVTSGKAFSLIRDFVVGMSNEAIEYTQAVSGQEENMDKGILVINARPLIISKNKVDNKELSGRIVIDTTKDLESLKNILEMQVRVIAKNNTSGYDISLKDAMILPSIQKEGSLTIYYNGDNAVTYKDFTDGSIILGKKKTEYTNVISALFDSNGKVVERVNKSAKTNLTSTEEMLAKVETKVKMEIVDSYSPLVKSTLQEGIANFKSKESKEVPDNVAPGKDTEIEQGKQGEPDNNSRKYNNRYNSLNEAKSCKTKVIKFLKDNECETDYEAGTCKVDKKTMKIEKALLKFKAPESLIKSYTTECTKEVNEALRLRRMR